MQNEVIKAIMDRRSIRAFKPEQISDAEINTILQAGIFAPSAMNQQNWHFTVVQNQELLNEINDKAKIGNNLRIHEGVTVGASGGDAPVIGNNVFLGTGCKVIGAISIANDVTIGANAVVVKSILEAGVTYAGVPAVKVSDNNSYQYVFWMK